MEKFSATFPDDAVLFNATLGCSPRTRNNHINQSSFSNT